MSIGEDIKRRRLVAKMSQDALAGKAGINQGHLSRIERGVIANITVTVLKSIASALGCKVVDLLAEEPNKNPKRRIA